MRDDALGEMRKFVAQKKRESDVGGRDFPSVPRYSVTMLIKFVH